MTPAEIQARYNWRKVVAPSTWEPSDVDEELVGFYGGRTLRDGKFGQYEVVIVHVPMGGSYTVSGTKLITLLDASLIKAGHPIRIVWKGLKNLENGHTLKDFEVLVAEGDALPVEALPEVQGRATREPPKAVAPASAPEAKPPEDSPTPGTMRFQVLTYIQQNPGSTGKRVEKDPAFKGRGTSARAMLSTLFYDNHLRREQVDGIWAYWPASG